MRIGAIVDTALYFYQMTVVVYVLLSWLQGMDWALRLRHALEPIVEPYVALFRRIVPIVGMVDFSPLVALLALQAVRFLIVVLLTNLGL